MTPSPPGQPRPQSRPSAVCAVLPCSCRPLPAPSPSLHLLLPQPSGSDNSCVSHNSSVIAGWSPCSSEINSSLICVPTVLGCTWAIGCLPHSFSSETHPSGAGGAAHLVSPARWPGTRQVAKCLNEPLDKAFLPWWQHKGSPCPDGPARKQCRLAQSTGREEQPGERPVSPVLTRTFLSGLQSPSPSNVCSAQVPTSGSLFISAPVSLPGEPWNRHTLLRRPWRLRDAGQAQDAGPAVPGGLWWSHQLFPTGTKASHPPATPHAHRWALCVCSAQHPCRKALGPWWPLLGGSHRTP